MKRLLLSLLPVVLLFVCVGVFFSQTLFKGLVPVPTDALIGLYHPWRDLYADTNPRGVPYRNFLITDPFRQQIPWKKLVIDSWKKGNIPTWDPYSFSGTPLIANVQAGVWYPLNIFFFVFPFLPAWSMYIIAQLLLASLFCYIYLRTLKLSPVASFVGSLLWTFSGFSIAWLTWGTIVQTAAWIPLGLAAVEMIRKEHASRKTIMVWTALLVMSLSCQLFAGHAQVALYGWAITAAYMLWRGFAKWFVLAWAITLAVTALVWIPMATFFMTTGRSIAPVWQKEGWFLPWEHLVQFFAPDFFGNPATGNYWGKWNYGEFIGSIGGAGLFFAMIAFVTKGNRQATFFKVLAVAALLFLLPSPVSMLPYATHIPLLSSLQPTRLMMVLDLALIVLAAYGVDWWWTNPRRKALWPVITGMSVAYLGLWASVFVLSRLWPEGAGFLQTSKRNLILPTVSFVGVASAIGFAFFYGKKVVVRYLCLTIIIGIAALELFRLGWKFTPFTPASYFFPETAVIRYLKQQKPPFRILSVDERIMPPNVSTYYGIETAEGYDPLFSKRYQEFMGTLQTRDAKTGKLYDFNRIVTVKNLGSPLFRLLGVSYILSIDPIADQQFTKVFEEGATKVYVYEEALPRAYFASSVVVAKTADVLKLLLRADAMESPRGVVIEEAPIVPTVQSAAGDTVEIRQHDAGMMDITTDAQFERFLVLTQSYSPMLRVTIDGVATKVYPTNYIFSGVVVPAGVHAIHVAYSL